jgi:hypothetical protein
MNPLNDISAVYLKEVLKPQLGKESPAKKEGGAEKPSADGGEKKEGDASAGSAKRIRQAVYDIRYRARREEIPVQQAYGQYMSHTTMTGPEKSEVKAKLGEERVTEAVEEKKFQVRVTDKNSGKSYVRMATREKINQLRANSNISSVEMTKYGTPYEGEKKKGEQTAKVKSGKGLDPVGREDKDIDNDGDHDKTDKYLLNRRKVRGAAIQNKNVKEGFSNWRDDLYEVVSEIEDKKKDKIKERKVNNKITINPPLKESIENLGGELLEVDEIEEGMTLKDYKKQKSRQKQKEKRAADKIAPTRRAGIHADKASPERAARHRANVDPDFEGNDERNYPGGKLKPKKVRKAKALGELGEQLVNEKAPPGAKFERMIKHIKKGYSKDGGLTDNEKSIAYATAWKAKNKMSEAMDTTTGVDKEPTASTSKSSKIQSTAQDAQRKQQIQQLRTMTMKKRQLQNQELALQKQGKLPVDTHATEEYKIDEARAEEKRGLGSTGAQRQRQKTGVKTSSGQVAHPATSYSGGQNPQLRGKKYVSKTQRRAASRRYVDQPGGVYAKPENKQGEGRYADMQAKKRQKPDLGSRFD